MSHEYFYHYTSKDGAKGIVLSGRIAPSLRANGDARYGDGVYLTTVDPSLGKNTVGQNNWGVWGIWGRMITGLSGKMKRYFEICIPSEKVRRARGTRDIQVTSN